MDDPSVKSPRLLNLDKWQDSIALIVGGVFVFALVYTIRAYFSPFVAMLAAFTVLYPLRRSPIARSLLLLSTILFLIWFVGEILPLLIPFLIAFLLAYLLHPLVGRLEKKHIPRWAATLIVIIVIVSVMATILIIVSPVIYTQFRLMINSLTPMIAAAVQEMSSANFIERLRSMGIPVQDVQSRLAEELGPRLGQIIGGAMGIFSNIGTVASQIINIILVPILTFHLLRDYPKIWISIIKHAPKRYRIPIIHISRKVDSTLGLYIRGAITVAFIIGTLSTLFLWLIGVQYPFVLGPLAGLLDLIPYFGVITTMLVSVIVALLSGGNIGLKVILVVGLFASLNLFESTVLQPKIVGQKVGIHPVVLILSLFVFGYFLGFWGLLLAVPSTALLIAFVNDRMQSESDENQQFPIGHA